MESQDRLILFQEMLACDPTIYYWCLDSEGRLIASSCPEVTVFFPLLRHSGSLEYALDVREEVPMILSNASGVVWAAVWEVREERRCRLHVIGPCLAYSLTPQIEEQARRLIDASAQTEGYKKRLIAGLERIPVLPMTVFNRYAAMLGLCVTGERTPLSRLHHQSNAQSIPQKDPPRDRMQVYRSERMLLQMVRSGNLNSGAVLQKAANTAKMQPYVPEPLGQAQIACTIFTSLCTRAAIEGGLNAEAAYSTGDGYIRRLFQAQTITEVTTLNHRMYQDFIQKVHDCRKNPNYSAEIQSCCDYMELHAEEPLTLELLAKRLGYSKYYLSHRFKEEVGCTINSYLQTVRVERAKMLLSCTDEPIAEIVASLQFATSSHFSVVFKRITGQSPAQYRAENQST